MSRDTAGVGTTQAPAEPTTRVGGRWLSLFTLAWLGVWLAQLTPIQLLLPEQVDAVRGSSAFTTGAGDWVGSVVAFGVVSAVAGVLALVAYPLAGLASDLTRSRLGRRRPWVGVGTALFAGGLLVLGRQQSLPGVTLGWSLALVGFCVLTAAITAMISDQVPVDQRGLVSGLVSAPQAVGVILGLAVVTAAGWGAVGGYTFSAVALVLLVVPFALLVRDPAVARGPRLGRRELLGAWWVDPRRHPDFGWALLGRLLVNLGNALGTTLLLFYLEYGLRRDDAPGDLLTLSVVYMVFVIATSVWLGRLSDRLGRRKPFVVAAALTQALAALLLVAASSLPLAVVAAGLSGAGYGCFLAVDQALATQVLPDPETRAKDLGIMNVAVVAPQAFGPLLGAGLVSLTAGFGLLFVVSALTGLAGAATTWFVRSVR
ncbi:MFS transporter [Marmoricola endophyticus]|uniref:MFS transporter n=1 Tax=Marmoricola endophyticus TaxID=2040280 RepID=A0A917BE09_9ACTN|nr:MFS transporter [Marmoricola endophyticus]GGF37704.1 MFS transporter [Marmoricola endophyticus]